VPSRRAALLAGLVPVLLALGPGPARGAPVLQAPVGARLLPLPAGRVLCGAPPEGWQVQADRRALQPPRPAEGAAGAVVGRAEEVAVAPSAERCAAEGEPLTLLATGPLPEVDASGVLLAADAGRLELRGRQLAGAQVLWGPPPGGEGEPGREACLAPEDVAGAQPSFQPLQQCVVPVRRGLRTDARLWLVPPGGRAGADVVTFDAAGRRLPPEALELRPARVLLSSVLPAVGALDLSTGGEGFLPLPHPEAVAEVECAPARCEVAGGGVRVRAVPAGQVRLGLRLRLAPRTLLQQGEALEGTASAVLQVLHCPAALASGPPLREVGEVRVVVRVDARCTRDAGALRWSANGEPAQAEQVVREGDGVFTLLRVAGPVGERVVLAATRSELDPTVVATLSSPTQPPPRPRVSLELPGHGKVDFIPTNRDAVLRVAAPGEGARLVPLPVEGAYQVRGEGGQAQVRGDENGGGFAQLLFGYRAEGLPAALRGVDLARVPERTQRQLREAAVPAPIDASALGDAPLVELLCADAAGLPRRVTPGAPARVPFEARDTCRVVLHRERLRPEDGLQEVTVEVEVTSASGAARPEARVSERMVLQPGGEARTLWVKGVLEQFDRIVVRVGHVADESRYLLSGASRRAALPAVQWSATVEGSRLRLYATATIPSGLYRLNAPTGQLSLNFGLLSRLTLLDALGKEGLLGLELGVMGVGLVQTGGTLNDFPPTLATVAGLGVRIPLGGGPVGGQAALSLHLWGAYEFRDPYYLKLPDGTRGAEVGRWALIFGPSISIGNIGTNL
jgi:hypothetical protein